MSAHLPCGGVPFSLSIRRTVSRNSRSSSAVDPTTCDAMIEDEAWPSAPASRRGSNGVDMDALIKSLREATPSETPQAQFRPAELDPSEFLVAAVRADQPRPSRAEAEQAVATLLGYIGEDTSREGLL